MNINYNGLNYLINTPTSAKVSVSQMAFGDIFIPRSITFQGKQILITSISSGAFMRNNRINSVIFEDNSEVRMIESDAFSDSSITKIVIPRLVNNIGQKAFFSCTNLTTVIFQDNSELQSIENLAFSSTSIQTIRIPSMVKIIGVNAFNRCSRLESITFSEDSELSVIGDNSFSFCKCLSSVSLPSRISKIGSSSFSYCETLKRVTFSENCQNVSIGIGVFTFSPVDSISIPYCLNDLLASIDCASKLSSLCYFGYEVRLERKILEKCANLRKIVIPNAEKLHIESGCGRFGISIPRGILVSGPGANNGEHRIDYIDKMPQSVYTRNKPTIVTPTAASMSGKIRKNKSDITSPKPIFIDDEPSRRKVKTAVSDDEVSALNRKVASMEEQIMKLENQLKAKSAEVLQLKEDLETEKQNHMQTRTLLKNLQKSTKKTDKKPTPFKEIQILGVEDIEKFERVKKLGTGGTAKVVKMSKPTYYALKIFNLDIACKKSSSGRKGIDYSSCSDSDDTEEDDEPIDMDKMRRFFKEYEILNQLDHPNIVKTFGFCYGDRSHAPSILLEYCHYNLKSLVKGKRQKSNDLVLYVLQICTAMKYLHKLGIIHRDLKPENILLDDNKVVKLSDFGISKLVDVETQTETFTQIMGTLQYMAPELFQKKCKYTEKVDVYSFGVILFFIVTDGELPNISIVDIGKGVKAKFPRSVNKFSKGLINSCWDFDPDKRPSFEEIIDMIVDNDYMLFDDVDSNKIAYIVESNNML